MDRSLLESDPHRVVEGMAIGAYAVGAENPLTHAERHGVLGNGICGTQSTSTSRSVSAPTRTRAAKRPSCSRTPRDRRERSAILRNGGRWSLTDPRVGSIPRSVPRLAEQPLTFLRKIAAPNRRHANNLAN